ncbi:MAG: hypothetical protein WAL52_11315 [Candidatus Sulfotelmatobacter sp.]
MPQGLKPDPFGALNAALKRPLFHDSVGGRCGHAKQERQKQMQKSFATLRMTIPSRGTRQFDFAKGKLLQRRSSTIASAFAMLTGTVSSVVSRNAK